MKRERKANPTEFSRRLKMLREERGLSKNSVASAVGISDSTLYYYEEGISDATIGMLKKLSKYYNVDPSWLMGLKDKRGVYEF